MNWASSFRTPADTLAHWQQAHGLADLTVDALAPWFAAMEERLGVAPWAVAPNENNAVLARGGERLGIPTAVIPRNVRGCWNLGYCGTGCPTNAKQSMLLTTLPVALAAGATLVSRLRVERLEIAGQRVTGLSGQALAADGIHPNGVTVTVRARHVVLAGGAINSPAVAAAQPGAGPPRPGGKAHFSPPPRWFPPPASPSPSRAFPGRRNRFIPTISCTPSRWTGPSASSWKRPPCTRCSWAPPSRAMAPTTPT